MEKTKSQIIGHETLGRDIYLKVLSNRKSASFMSTIISTWWTKLVCMESPRGTWSEHTFAK